MHPNPVVEEVREIRHRISERFGHDPRRLVEYYRGKLKEYADRLWRGRTFEESPEQPAEPDAE
jgi:hypothetical protein